MAKKKFDYIRDADEPWQPRVQRQSRAEQAEVPAEAAAIVDILLAMPPAHWEALPLSGPTLEALREHSRIKPGARRALRRQVGRIGAWLRKEDLTELQAALDDAAGGRSDREEAIDALVRWRTELVSGGNDALTAFLDAHPTADRQRIRQLVANAVKALGTPSESRRQRALLDALKESAGL